MKRVEDVFIRNPYLEFKDLATVREKMSGPLPSVRVASNLFELIAIICAYSVLIF